MTKLFRWRRPGPAAGCACPHAGCCATAPAPTYSFTFPPTAPGDRARAAQLIRAAIVRHQRKHGGRPVGGLVQVVDSPPVPVPYPVSAEHPPADFDG